jgi:hypothetical protein
MKISVHVKITQMAYNGLYKISTGFKRSSRLDTNEDN